MSSSKSKKEGRGPDKMPAPMVSRRWENLKIFLAILLSIMFLTVAYGVYQIMQEKSAQEQAAPKESAPKS